MDKPALHNLLKLLAGDIYPYAFRDEGKVPVPEWVMRKDRPHDVVHDGRWYELVTAKSERAMLVFDQIAAAHNCTGRRRLCFAHESIRAWPEIRRMWQEASEVPA